MSTLTNPQDSTPEAATTFGRVLVGIDGSPESLEAARQAALLKEPGGSLELSRPGPPYATGRGARLGPAGLRERRGAARENAERALDIAKTRVPSADALIVRGFAARAGRRDRTRAINRRGCRISRSGTC